jgi:hypothetical protein
MTDRSLLGTGDQDRSMAEPARVPGHGSLPAPVVRAWVRGDAGGRSNNGGGSSDGTGDAGGGSSSKGGGAAAATTAATTTTW